jgi:tetratricopeptide (TPR) repeat protein
MPIPSIEFYNEALDALQAGNLTDALSAVENSLTENAADTETWQLYVMILNALHRHEEASKAEEKVKSLGICEADLLMLKVAQAESKHDITTMLSCYEEALAIAPERADIHAGYAMALLESKQSDAALQAAQLALSIAPKDPRINYVLGRILRLSSQYEAALTPLQQAIAAEPNFSVAEYECGMVLHHLGRHEEALEHFNRVLEANPSDVSAMEAINIARIQMS